jgi:hypothetical protein
VAEQAAEALVDDDLALASADTAKGPIGQPRQI